MSCSDSTPICACAPSAFCVGARAASTAVVATRPRKRCSAAILAAHQRKVAQHAAERPSTREDRRAVCSFSSVASFFITAMRTFPSQVFIISIRDQSSFGASSFAYIAAQEKAWHIWTDNLFFEQIIRFIQYNRLHCSRKDNAICCTARDLFSAILQKRSHCEKKQSQMK